MSDSAAADCRQNTVRLRRVDAAAWISRVYRSQCCSASHASARTYTPWRRRLSSPASACRASLRESRPRRARSLLRIRAGRSIHRYWPPHRSHNNSPAPGCGKHWQRIRGAFRQALRFRTRAPRIRAAVVRNRSRNTPASPTPCLSAPRSSETAAETCWQPYSAASTPATAAPTAALMRRCSSRSPRRSVCTSMMLRPAHGSASAAASSAVVLTERCATP